jgi:hypothetical protein
MSVKARSVKARSGKPPAADTIVGKGLAEEILDHVFHTPHLQERIRWMSDQAAACCLDAGEDPDICRLEEEETFSIALLVLDWVCEEAARIQLACGESETELALFALVGLVPSWESLQTWRQTRNSSAPNVRSVTVNLHNIRRNAMDRLSDRCGMPKELRQYWRSA